MLVPVFRDFISPAYPYVIPQTLGIVKKVVQPLGSSRLSHQSTVQANTHHLGTAPPSFFNEVVQRVYQVLGEVIGIRKAVRNSNFHIVLAQRVRDDQMWSSILGSPVWKIVGVGIGIIQEPTLLHHQPTSMSIGFPLINPNSQRVGRLICPCESEPTVGCARSPPPHQYSGSPTNDTHDLPPPNQHLPWLWPRWDYAPVPCPPQRQCRLYSFVIENRATARIPHASRR